MKKNKPSISYNTKGSINLLDRENTKLECTPTIKNYTDQITSVELYGNNASKFNVELIDGNVYISAKANKALKEKTAYSLNINTTLSSGVELTSVIKVTPKQVVPKLTQNVKQIVLFESASGNVYGQKVIVSVPQKYVATIKDISLAAESDTFGYEYKGDGSGLIYVKSTASSIPGKKYKVKLAVTYDNQASNAKSTYVTITVDYRK